ncbi:condensin-2 complex subunit G2-like isoform X2 [Antedon mediterranea]|uniref:condensin-2 complex subunit G2-like isoform X2 n=1 Tax=Antedon mediterranea TaxID=105859 RepID=UPI003AF7EA65
MMIESFIDACNGTDPKKLHNLISKHNKKNDDFNLREVLPVYTKKKQEQMWDGLYNLMIQLLTKTPFMQNADDEELQILFHCLQDILTITDCVLDQANIIIPDKMLQTITALHELLLDFPEKAISLQASIAKVCQTWWIKELEGREALVANTIMFFLVKSLQPDASLADVKRVYSLRASLLQIDYADESSTTIKNLLLRCVISPTFLKPDEGQRFLSYLFGLNLEFIEQLHKVIKNQVPACPKPMVEWYGNVYFKAWKLATGPYIDKIEQHCIQDLMHHAVHASREGTRSMSSTLRKILGCFHKQKVHQGVDKMLLNLYNPILWRSLKVANGTVRANSIAILVDTFPLLDPEHTNEERDILLQKQFDILSELLYDPCVVVRTTCVIGICRIISVFWELIPLKTSEDLLTKLVQDLARDVSSTDVRAAVYKGLTSVLDNRLSHVLMKRLLPQIGVLIHDTSEKVRITFIDLILKVKGVRDIKVNEIVPVEHLLVRLELDSAPIVRRLVQLLFNSFQPLDKAGEVQLTRCIALVQANPAAARVFYRYAQKHMSPADSAKFILLIGQCVFGCVQRSLNSSDSEDEVEKENDGEVLTLADKDIIDGLLEVMVIIWTNIEHQLNTTHTEVRQKLVKRFSKAVPLFIDVFQGGRSLEAVLYLASFLPGSALPDIKENCLKKLELISSESSMNDIAPLLECLVSWGKGEDILNIIHQRLKNIKPQYQQRNKSNKTRKGRKLMNVNCTLLQETTMNETEFDPSMDITQANEDEEKESIEQCKVALRLLNWLLGQPTTRAFMMQANLTNLMQVLSALKTLMESIQMDKPMNKDMEAVLEQVIYSYCKTLMHIQAEQTETDRDLCGEFLTSFMTAVDIFSEPITFHSTQCRWVKCFLTVNTEAFMVGQVTVEIAKNSAGFLAIILQKDPPVELMPSVVSVLYQVCLKLMTSNDEAREDDIIPLLIMHIIKLLAQKIKDAKEDVEKILSAVKPGLMETLICYHRNNPDNCQHVLATIMAATIAELTSIVHEEGKLQLSESFSDLPILSSFLMTLVNSKVSILGSFVGELHQCVSVGGLRGIDGLLAAVYIVYTIAKAGKKTNGLNECVLLVQQEIAKLNRTDNEESERNLIEQANGIISELNQHMGWIE